jgi:hypothetical protein
MEKAHWRASTGRSMLRRPTAQLVCYGDGHCCSHEVLFRKASRLGSPQRIPDDFDRHPQPAVERHDRRGEMGNLLLGLITLIY